MPMHGEFQPNGVWIGTRETPTTGGPALFLDRDGVVVVEVNYLCRPEDVRLEAGAAALIVEANRRGIPVAVATNQSGLDRGTFGWEAFFAVEAEIEAHLEAVGAHIDAVAACPFHPKHTPEWSDPTHGHWRKPGGGMIRALAARLKVDAARSWMIGDKASDIQAARAAGLAGAIHVATGHGHKPTERAEALAAATAGFVVLAAETVTAAMGLVLGRLSGELGGPAGPEPTRYGDWEKGGRCTDF